DAVARDEQQPVGGPALAEPGVGEAPDGAGQPSEGHGRAEDGGDEAVFHGALAGVGAGLAFREVPVRAGRLRGEALLREGGTVCGVEVDPPAGDARLQLLVRLTSGGGLCGVRHGLLSFQLASATMMGLMQSSSFAENMWYASEMCSSGTRWVTMSFG